jgi:diguanylate cyclase (GGDEF)-like protein/PAS domain S-box-containing protein
MTALARRILAAKYLSSVLESLLRARLSVIFILGVVCAVIVSEIIVAAIHALWWGSHETELIVAGFVTPLLDASFILFFILALIDRHHEASRELFKTKQMFEQIAEGITESILLISKDYRVLWGNEAALRQTGFSLGALTGMTCYEATHHASGPCSDELDPCPIKDLLSENAETVEHVHIDGSGNRVTVEVSAYPIRDESGETTGYVHITRDITERKKTEQKFRIQSRTDALTGLANRRAVDDVLDEEWRRAIRTNAHFSLMMIDVDFFKKYNDSYGHLEGDEALKSIARIIKSYARRPGDIAARVGGEEFLLVVSSNDHIGAMLAEKLCRDIEALAIPHRTSDIGEYLTVSVGVTSCVPRNSIPPSELMALADSALYAAKKQGRNRVVFDGCAGDAV